MSHSVNTISPIPPEAPPANEIPEEPHSRRYSFLSSQRLVFFFFMLMIFAAAAKPITDPDFWWHLKTGQYVVETTSIPHSDIFSTPRFGSEWVTHEWLSEVLMFLIFRAAGFAGLIIFFALIITTAFCTMYRRCVERTGHPYIAVIVTIL